jgi:hypothetical protein
MHTGSCLCGTVHYEVRGEPGAISVCHCTRCRKSNGSAFNAVAAVGTRDFHLLSGRDALKEYTSSPGVHRVFCGVCGSPLYSRRDVQPELLRLRLGTLDTKIGTKPVVHIFVADKADWYDIHDEAPQYAQRPAG